MSSHVIAAKSFGLRNDLLPALLFALAYFLGAELGYALSLGPSVGGTFWPPSGISLAALLVAPRRMWPVLIVAAMVANFASDLLHGQTLGAAVGFVMANVGEPLVGALILRRLFGARVECKRSAETLALAIVAALISTPLAAVVGALTAEWYTPNPPGFLEGWRTWWVGDAVGALVLTPCVARIASDWPKIAAVPLKRWLEVALFGAVLFAVTQAVFTAPPPSFALPFLVFPVMLWGSLRFGPIGVGAALCLVVVLATHDTAAGQGPFSAEPLSIGDRLVALQIYIGAMALSFHSLSVLWEERAQAAAALKLAHSGLTARYRRIVEQSPLAIVGVARDGAVLEANPAGRRHWGATAAVDDAAGAAAIGRELAGDGRLKSLLERAFTGEVVEMPEREIVVVDEPQAEPRRVSGVAYPIKDESGAVSEVVLIERDITDDLRVQRQLLEANRTLREREEALSRVLAQMAGAQTHREQLLEAERFARAEAERASHLKDEFLATLSHELRTPLNAIVGWAHILRRTPEGPVLEQAVETIERNARAQAKLIDDLLDMSRIMAGKVGMTLEHVPMGTVVMAAVKALEPVAEGKGIALDVNLDAAANAPVLGDAARLQQVVTNLLGNAIKFTPSGGRVDLELALHRGSVQLVLRDTGEGISPEFLPNVFERFRQADGSTTRRHGGLGLGLSIAKQIVDMHGGSITAASDGVDCGATFTMTLPLAAEGSVVSEAGGSERYQPVEIRGLRVLVVDDEADARELLRRLLSEHGADVSAASSADDAYTEVAAHDFDVLLTDIGMPGTDGYELLRRVRAASVHQPKAIAVTAFARPEDRERVLRSGFDAHLAKPVSAALLLQTLAEI